jgi:hypothetical protein
MIMVVIEVMVDKVMVTVAVEKIVAEEGRRGAWWLAAWS